MITPYLTNSDALALAATLPSSMVSAIVALGDVAQLTACLLEASDRVDVAMRYQGHKYDLTQAREFPRVPYDLSGMCYPGLLSLTGPFVFGLLGYCWGGFEIWDIDPATGNVVVPRDVNLAVLLEANEIASGDQYADMKDAQHAGMSSQGVGKGVEAYRAGNIAVLCRRATEKLVKYQLGSGGLL